MKFVLALALAALCCVSVNANVNRLIGAFNIQVFGPSKASNAPVMDELCEILKRYDIVVIQEIRNSDGTAIVELLDLLNGQPDVNGAYAMDIGPRVGRTSSKEQYAYFYRHALFQVMKSYTYADSNDVFEREPYQVHFSDKESNKDFVLSALHAKPDDAVAELDHLPTVYSDIIKEMGTESVFFLGDLNADCSYVTSTEMDELNLRTDSRFNWRIEDDADTTVSTTDCAYDRFVGAGEIDTFVTGGAVYNFEQDHSLSNCFAKEVSDHYPVEITLTY